MTEAIAARCQWCTARFCDGQKCRQQFFVCQHDAQGMQYPVQVATRDFVYLRFGEPQVIRAGERFRQNPLTKQVCLGNCPADWVVRPNRCSICLQNHLDADCPNRHAFWVATQTIHPDWQRKEAIRDFIVIYAGTYVLIRTGQCFYQNPDTKQVIVGWHGSTDPPCDMDGISLLHNC